MKLFGQIVEEILLVDDISIHCIYLFLQKTFSFLCLSDCLDSEV